MKLSAVVHPGRAPAWLRWGWYGAAVLLFLLGCLMLNTFPSAPSLLAAGISLFAIAPLVVRRSEYRATVETEPGALLVRPRFGLPFRVEARLLGGTSLAMIGEAPVATIGRARACTSFELERGANTEDLRKVLGMPTTGFGELWWTYAPRPIEYIALVGRALGAFVVAALAVASGALPSAVASGGVIFVAAAAFVVMITAFLPRSMLAMNGRGIVVREAGRDTFFDWGEIADVGDDGRALTIRANDGRSVVLPCAPTRWMSSGLREGERRAMVAQLRAAVARSKTPIRIDESAEYVSELARGFTSTTAWITRLDAMAAATNAPAGYRGATVPLPALWHILEDHDAEPAARAAAARILTRATGEEGAARIDAAVLSIRDDHARSLVRAVLGEDAQAVLEDIEREARLAGELTK